MGRTSLAETFNTEHEDEAEDHSTYLVIYDFERKKPSARFWENLHRVSRSTEAGPVQLSVFKTRSRRWAHTVAGLAKYYGAKVHLFRVEQEELRP